MEEYPEEIYITREADREDSFLAAHENLTSAADLERDREIAIYKLVRIANIKTSVEVIEA